MDEYVVVIPTCFVCKVFKTQPCTRCLKTMVQDDVHTISFRFRVVKTKQHRYKLWADVGYVCIACHTDELKIAIAVDFFAFVDMMNAFLQEDLDKVETSGSCKSFLARLILPSTRYYGKIMKFVSNEALCAGCNGEHPRKRCKGCMFVKYCSNACAEKDWKNHKWGCKWIQNKKTIFLLDKKLEL